ncbi:FlgO family outer membrane protein [Celerinatantimonas yamalensis]|uniref:FlgO family outer membrane protein n=1 Tax=Celerinatantimonas yamalensis TaxID=559956 RepID=A0ABW9G753_9GAMM
MRYCWVVLITILLSGCNMITDHRIEYTYVPPKESKDSQFYSVVLRLTDRLLARMPKVRDDQTLAISSIVNLDKFGSTDGFGRQLSESMFAAFDARGVRLVEPRVTGRLVTVPESGEFALSRNAKTLAKKINITYMLVGSYQPSHSGLNVNVRIIRLSDRVVVSAVYEFFPADVTPVVPSVRSVNGGFVRNDIQPQ